MNRRKFLQAAGVGAGLGATGASTAFHNSDFGISPISGRPYIQPTYGDVGNVQVLGYCDMSFKGTGKAQGWDQIYDFKVRDTPQGRFAYCPNGAPGWSIVDVTNPRNMFVTWRQPWERNCRTILPYARSASTQRCDHHQRQNKQSSPDR